MDLRTDATPTTVVALLRAFHNDRPDEVKALLETNDARYMLGAACAWFNGLGITHFGAEEWDRQLLLFLQQSAE